MTFLLCVAHKFCVHNFLADYFTISFWLKPEKHRIKRNITCQIVKDGYPCPVPLLDRGPEDHCASHIDLKIMLRT